MKITVVRHTAVAVEPDICYGQSNVDVADSFEMEAALIITQLQHSCFDAVYSSPSQRCTKLANYCGFKTPFLDSRLMELDFGDWEMKAWTEINDPQLKHWYADWINEKPTNGESFRDQIERVKSFLNDLQTKDYLNIAIFTHAGVIRALGVLLKKFPIENIFGFKVEYGQVIEFGWFPEK
ncbi:MAG TPA: alpha-ribazole phosphatase [Paludibacter sp.]